MSSRRVTFASVAGIAVGAPFTAEYLQAYLPSTGDLPLMLVGLLIFTPLYGGAALLIRETAVRTGRGWTGILLLAAGFGVAMPGVIDLAMFGAQRPDIPYWAELREPTLIEPLQLSASATLGWVAGHVVMSIGAPLAVYQALAPSTRGRPLLGRWGITVTLLLWLAAAALVHGDGRSTYGYAPSTGQMVGVLLAVVILVALAMSRIGRPIRTDPDGRAISAVWILGAGVVGKVAFDLLPPSWTGFAISVGLLGTAAVLIRWLAAHRRWSSYEIGLVGAAMIIGGILIGFVAPLPEGVPIAAKIGQGAAFLLLAIALTAAVCRTTPDSASEERMNR